MNPILAAFNPVTADREPVDFGAAAARILGGRLAVVAVRTDDDVDDAVSHLRLELQRRGVRADVRVREARSAGDGVAAALTELEPAMVVLGPTHRGTVGSALLGTTIERTIHAAACPVVVVPKGYALRPGGVRLIGAAFAPTPEGRTALGVAAAFARVSGARLRAIHVLDRGRFKREETAELDAALAEVADGIEAEGSVLAGDPADTLLAAAGELDALVVGSRGLGPRKAVVLGSVSRKVAERCTCPVVVLPRAAEALAEALIGSASGAGVSRGR
jgi:nucleotide-binding universal stress UspA family protein